MNQKKNKKKITSINIVDGHEGKMIIYKNIENKWIDFEIIETSETHLLTQLQERNLPIHIYCNPIQTEWIPQELYHDKMYQTYFLAYLQWSNMQNPLQDEIKIYSTNAILFFSLSDHTLQQYKAITENIYICHIFNNICTTIFRNQWTHQLPTMYIAIFQKNVTIVVTKEKNLLLCKSYLYEKMEDILYIILHIYTCILEKQKMIFYWFNRTATFSFFHTFLKDYIIKTYFIHPWDKNKQKHNAERIPLDMEAYFSFI